MAYATRRAGGGGWTSVRPYTTYGNVIANYGAALQQAQETASNVELQTKILEYKNGTASYQDVVNLLKTKQTGAIPGSQRELDLKEVGLQLEQYETNKNREIKRADLKTKYAKGGISAEEQLQIEKEMLNNYKEGTPEYSEQLSNIATATELRNQEQKTAKMAQIQAAITEGGITIDEEIQLFEEGKNMSDKGSEEYFVFEQKINDAKQRKEEQDIAVMASEKYSELLDKYKGGGLDNEEKLKINTELMKIYKPGSADYIKAQENEAELLGGIANERRAAGKDAQELETQKARFEFQVRQQKIENLDKDIAQGINPVGALNEKMRLYGEQRDLINQYGEDAGSNLPEWTVNIENTANLKNQIDSGRAVVVSRGESGGMQMTEIVPIENLRTMGEEKVFIDPETGKPMRRKVISIIDREGNEKQVVYTDDGGLQEVSIIKPKGKKVTEDIYGLGAMTGYNAKNVSKTMLPKSSTGGEVLGVSTAALQTPAIPGVTYTPPKPKSGSSSKSSSKPKAQSTNNMTQTPAIAGITYTAPKTNSGSSTKNQSPLQLQTKMPTTNKTQQYPTSGTSKKPSLLDRVKSFFGF